MAFSLCSTAATSSSSCKQNHLKGSLVHMRKISAILFALMAVSAFADSNSEHIEHLKMMMHAMSQHGAVVAQPLEIQPAATRTIDIQANCFQFSPSQFTVNQGDIVTLNITVPSADNANGCQGIGHGLLMDTYVEQGV